MRVPRPIVTFACEGSGGWTLTTYAAFADESCPEDCTMLEIALGDSLARDDDMVSVLLSRDEVGRLIAALQEHLERPPDRLTRP